MREIPVEATKMDKGSCGEGREGDAWGKIGENRRERRREVREEKR